MKISKYVKTLFTRCDRCQDFGAEKYRQNTSYVDDEQNFITLCPFCKEENDEYWNDMWEEYRQGRF